MIKALGNFLGTALGLALLVGLLAGGYFLFRYVVELFGGLDPTVATLTAIASVVALLCAATIASGLKSSSQAEREASAGADKSSVYEPLLSLWVQRFNSAGKEGDAAAEAELRKLEPLLALRAHPKVIAAYAELQRLSQDEQMHSNYVAAGLSRLVLEMRKDLGKGVLNLRDSDVLSLLLASR